MLEINIDHRGELYRDHQVFRLVINGTVMIDGEYPAQGLHDFASLIAGESQRISGHGGIIPKLTGGPCTAAEHADVERKRAAYRRAEESRNAAREMKPAAAKVTDPPAPLLRLPDLPIRRRPRPENMRPNKSTWRKTVEFFTGKSE